MSAKDISDLIQLVGIPVAILVILMWLFLRGKIHSDGEFQEMKEQRNHYRDQAEKLVNLQEEATPAIKKAVTDKSDLAGMAELVDMARRQGLI